MMHAVLPFDRFICDASLRVVLLPPFDGDWNQLKITERLSRALKTVGPIDCDLTGPGCRFALKMIKYKRCSDVIVVTRRHVGGIVIVNKDRVKMLEI